MTDDPLVMWIVARHRAELEPAEVWWTRSWRGVLDACAVFRGDPVFDLWEQASYRKVALRAKGSEWARLLAAEPDAVLVDEALAVVRPRRRSEAPREISRLNVVRWGLEDLPGQPPLPPAPGGAGAVECLVRASLGMGVGKQIAQVAHAAMLAQTRLGIGARAQPAFVLAGEARWAAAKAHRHVVVRDSGLTEVAPGTETVLVAVQPTPTRSTTKTSVSSGPMTPPAPRLP